LEYNELCLHEAVVVILSLCQWPIARGSYKYKIKDRNFISDEIKRIMLTPESDDLSDDSLELNEKWRWHQAANMIVIYNYNIF
jgi:hypothetical protein